MSRWACVQNGVVVNVIEWDGTTEYDPPPSTTLVPAGATTTTGDTLNPDGKTFRFGADPAAIVGLDVSVDSVAVTMASALPNIDALAAADPGTVSVQDLQQLAKYVAKMIRYEQALITNRNIPPTTIGLQ